MPRETSSSIPLKRLRALAQFRYELRRFLHFSEAAAAELSMQPQQHQMLLQIAGAPDGAAPTVAYVAERLGLRHNTVVELGDRCEDAGLLTRAQDPRDHRRVLLRLTPKGRDLLEQLAGHHARELNELGPRLIRSLRHIQRMNEAGRDGMDEAATGVPSVNKAAAGRKAGVAEKASA